MVILLLLLLLLEASSSTTTTTNYDDIAHQYHTIKGNVIKKYSEEYTVLQHLLQHQQQQKEANDMQTSNKTTPSIMMLDRLLDLGCGDGHYTRLFRQHGLAQTIVGVDASAKMLQRAREIDNNNQDNNNGNDPSDASSPIIYQLGNVLDEVGLFGDLNEKTSSFDLVVAIYLIPYATNRHELEHMMRTIYQVVAPGGRFYTVLLNPDMTREAVHVQKAYGAEIIPATTAAVDAGGRDPQDLPPPRPPPWTDGTQLQMKLSHGSNFNVEFVNYYWTQTTLEHVLVQVGFDPESIAFRPMQLDPVGIQELGERFWEPYMQHPAIMALQCTKPPASPATSPAAVTKDDDTHDDTFASKEEL
jgi:toxoflavin synthase